MPDHDACSILVVDDHEATLAELRALIDRQPDLHVVGTETTAEAALNQVDVLAPDVVVMDLVLPGMSGLEAVERLRGSSSQRRVVILSDHDGSGWVQAAFARGARAYLHKEDAYLELVPAIRAVAQGRRYLGRRALS